MTSSARNSIVKYLIVGSGPSGVAVAIYLMINGIRPTIVLPSLPLGSITPTVMANAVGIVRTVLGEGKS